MAGTEMVSLTDADEAPEPSHRESELPPPRNRKDYLLGIFLLIIVVLLWTSSNFVTQVRSHPQNILARPHNHIRLFLQEAITNLSCEYIHDFGGWPENTEGHL
jgi:hypothetical protein